MASAIIPDTEFVVNLHDYNKAIVPGGNDEVAFRILILSCYLYFIPNLNPHLNVFPEVCKALGHVNISDELNSDQGLGNSVS